MDNRFLQFLQIFTLILDLFFLNLAYLIAQAIFPESAESTFYFRYYQFWILLNLFWIFLTWVGELYSAQQVSRFPKFMGKTMQSYGLLTLLLLAYSLLPRRVPLSNAMVITALAIFFVGLVFNRFVYLGIKEWVKREVQKKRKALIIGYNSLGKKLAHYLERDGLGLQIAGFVDDKPPKSETPAYPFFPGIQEALTLSKELQVNELYSTIMPENNHRVYNLMQQADKNLVRFRIVPDFSYIINRPVFIDYIDDLPILSVRKEPLEEVMNRFKKRAFDIVVSSLVTVFILSWLVPLLGLIIYVQSPGPIIFKQLRSGKDNKPFWCYKFRSMTVNKDANTTQATKNDARVTKIGKIMRKTSLDEFPQFWNVLKGEMSIVGPRPHMLKHTEDFSNLAEDYMIRQFLKPGITGWAQVNGYRGEITELLHIKKRVEFDLQYLENWSLWLDVKIMFLTVYNAVRGEENAY